MISLSIISRSAEQKTSFELWAVSRSECGKQNQRRIKMRNTSAPAVEPAAKAPATSTTQADTPPLTGANSFTEDQARERIAKAGFQEVKNLKKDDSGIWRGQATKAGQAVAVALDYRGNVVQQ